MRRQRAPTRSRIGRGSRTHVPEGLPLTLHAYRLLTAAATPLAPALMSHRLKRGKEHAARLNERYGQSELSRPRGSLVWLHGASVGELVSVIPLIERISEKRFAVLCTSGTVTSANLAEQRLPKGVIHQFVILDTPADPESLTVLRAAIAGRTLIAGASTHAGEEAVLIEAHRRLRGDFPRLLTIIAPRHPERGGAILELAKAADLNVALRSRGELPGPDTDVYVADTLGELGLIYRVAPVVFVGGSLVSHGGQNPIEPIKLGAAILHGPNVWNFAEVYAALDKSHGAQEVSDVEGFALRAAAWLKDAHAREAVITAGQATVAALGGSFERTLAALEPHLMRIGLKERERHA